MKAGLHQATCKELRHAVEEIEVDLEKRSNDRCGASKRLSEEAEEYIQDFVSNVEDMEIQSLDGDKTDTGSSIGGLVELDNVQTTPDCQPLVEMDGVVLPWLHWETCNDVSTPSCEEQSMWSLPTGKFNSFSAAKHSKEVQDRSCLSPSRLGSCTPGTVDGPSLAERYTGSLSVEARKSNELLYSRQFNMDEYPNVQNKEDFLTKTLRRQNRIDSGGMLL